MRLLLAIAFVMLGAAAASAADLGGGRAGRAKSAVYVHPVGRHAGQIVLYDWEPGVVARAYWLRPWRGRHYFPFGRYLRHARVHWRRPRPAPDFFRTWSASSDFDSPPRYWAPLPPRPPAFVK